MRARDARGLWMGAFWTERRTALTGCARWNRCAHEASSPRAQVSSTFVRARSAKGHLRRRSAVWLSEARAGGSSRRMVRTADLCAQRGSAIMDDEDGGRRTTDDGHLRLSRSSLLKHCYSNSNTMKRQTLEREREGGPMWPPSCSVDCCPIADPL